MNAKKELLVTSVLAITLAVGLGALSFGLFSSTPPNVQIEVSAKKNGVASLSFLPEDQVLIEAQVMSNNASVVGAPVNFEVESPNGTGFLKQSALTNSLGIANVTFQIPGSPVFSLESTWEVGMWQTKATIKIYGQTLYATTNFTCEANVEIDVSAMKNEATSLFFLPLDQVELEAHVTSNNASVVGAPVDFEVKSPNGTNFLTQPSDTDSLGEANFTFQIPWPSVIVGPGTPWELGKWQTKATARVYGQAVSTSSNFTCETVTPSVDLYTQEGGQGPNAPGGTFAAGKLIPLYVEVRDELNQTLGSQMISLQVLTVGASIGNYTWQTATTNASGIATIQLSYANNSNGAIEYENVVTWEYTTSTGEYMVLSDSMTITVQPSS